MGAIGYELIVKARLLVEVENQEMMSKNYYILNFVQLCPSSPSFASHAFHPLDGWLITRNRRDLITSSSFSLSMVPIWLRPTGHPKLEKVINGPAHHMLSIIYTSLWTIIGLGQVVGPSFKLFLSQHSLSDFINPQYFHMGWSCWRVHIYCIVTQNANSILSSGSESIERRTNKNILFTGNVSFYQQLSW